VTLLGGKNESLVSNRKCACKNPNLEILGTPPRCQTKCSNTGGRHENNDPTKPCVCPSGTAYIQNAGCTKMIFQNQTSTPVVKNVSATLTPTSTATPQPVSTLTPQTTKTPTLSPAQTSTPTSTPQTADYRPQTYLPIITPTPKREEYSPLVPSRAVPTQIPQPVQIIKQVAQQIVPLQNTPSTAMQPIVKSIPQKLSDEQCKSLLNNFAKQQYDSFLKSWPQINLMAQQANFKGQFERMRNQLEHSLKTFVEYEAEQKKCDDDLAEDIVDSWLANFDSSFKKFAEEKKEQIKGRGLGRK
jgi:hypothetical protein